MVRPCAVFVVVLLAGAVPEGPAPAAAADKAVVRSFAYHAVPAEATIDVVPWNDSRQNLRIEKAFQVALEEQGRVIEVEAPLALRFDTEVLRRGAGPQSGSLGQVEGGTGSGVRAELNVWSSTEDSLLTGRQRRGDERVTLLQLSATLEETAGKRRVLWRGEAQTQLQQQDIGEAGARIAPILVGRLGQATKPETVRIEP